MTDVGGFPKRDTVRMTFEHADDLEKDVFVEMLTVYLITSEATGPVIVAGTLLDRRGDTS